MFQAVTLELIHLPDAENYAESFGILRIEHLTNIQHEKRSFSFLGPLEKSNFSQFLKNLLLSPKVLTSANERA